MLTSAVSYMPYCEQVRGEREDSGAFAMQVPDYASSITPYNPNTVIVTEAVHSEAYSAEGHGWKGYPVEQHDPELDTDGDNNAIYAASQAPQIFEAEGGKFKTVVGSQCRNGAAP